jgi:hypothetical protein
MGVVSDDQLVASTVDAVLQYLYALEDYSIWASALDVARPTVEAVASRGELLFLASDDQSCELAGHPSGPEWVLQDPASFLYHIVELPRRWYSCESRFYECRTLAADGTNPEERLTVQLLVTPQSFVLPGCAVGDAISCTRAALRPLDAALVLRRSFFFPCSPTSTLHEALQERQGDLSAFSDWLALSGMASLPGSGGTYTFLAPTNAALRSLAAGFGISVQDLLQRADFSKLLHYHLVPGRASFPVSAGGVPSSAVAADGFLVSFQRLASGRSVNAARVIEALSVEVGNGSLLAIDAVLSHGLAGFMDGWTRWA